MHTVVGVMRHGTIGRDTRISICHAVFVVELYERCAVDGRADRRCDVFVTFEH